MFYELVLLRRQNQGKFAMAWVASTRGIQHVIKEFGLDKVRDIDIIILCEETMDYLRSSSNNPRERVSLRMAVHLIQGTIILFNKKVSIFQDDLSKCTTCLSIFPKEIALPRRKKDPTQRMFKTPPTPVIKEKTKKTRVAAEAGMASILEEFLRGTTEVEAAGTLPRLEDVPPLVEPGKESFSMLQAQPLQVVIPEDMFGDFDVIPAQIAPRKPPSEVSEKSQLEKIEDLLIAERIAEHEELMKKTATPPKKSSSSSVDEGPRIIQVEALVHAAAVEHEKEIAEKPETYQKSSSSNGIQEGPATIVVEAMVHRSAEVEEPIIHVEQPPQVSAVVEPMEIVEEIQTVREVDTIKEQAKLAEIEMEIQSVLEKQVVVTKKRPALRQLQRDEIPTQDQITPRRSLKEERERREKEEQISKFLRVKFKPARRVLHLDDYNKITHKEKFEIEIFEEDEILSSDLADFLMGISTEKQTVEDMPMEQMRKEGSSRSLSEVFKRPSKVPSTLTPLETPSHRMSEPASVEIMSQFETEAIRSTPFRGDMVEMPSKKLYEETKIEYEVPVPETIDRKQEMIVEAEPVLQLEQIEKEPELPRRSLTDRLTPTKKKDEEERRKNIEAKVKLWDENQDYLLVDDLIPLPKNRLNAARTFHLLLRLAKERKVVLISEENSLEVKYVKKGTYWQH